MVAPVTVAARLRVPLVILTALLLHTTVLSHLRLFGVTPDVMLLVAVAGGLSGGPGTGALVGFAAGMAIDLFLQTPLGLSALVFSLVGYGVGTIHNALLKAAWWIPVVTAFGATAAGEALYGLAGAVVGERKVVLSELAVIVPVVALVNAALAPFVIRVVDWALGEAPASRVGLV